jgi:uncharacterized protein (TIGR02246 family)
MLDRIHKAMLLVIAVWFAGIGNSAFAAEDFPVEQLYEQFQSTLNSDDAEGWLALWTDDGVQMPDGVAPVVGKEAIRQGILRNLEQLHYDMDVSIGEVRVMGDIAYVWGTYTVDFTVRADGSHFPLHGTYLTIWQRQHDGGWKVHRDIINAIGPHVVE